MKRILVFGGTGNIGSKVISKLVSSDVHVRAMVRNREAITLPAQVEIFEGDLTLPETLSKSLVDIDAVFLIWTAPPEFVSPALNLITSHVKRIVYLSAPIHTPHPFFQASLPNAMSIMHEKVEDLIVKSGCDHTFLRPGMMASNAIDWWASQIRAGDLIRWPYLQAPTAPIDELDIASVAVHTLLDEGHYRADYVLTGPQSLTQFEQLTAIGQAIGRNLKIEEISNDDLISWNSSWPEPIKNMLLKSWAAAIGQPAYLSSSVEDITRVPAKRFFDWAKEHTNLFKLMEDPKR